MEYFSCVFFHRFRLYTQYMSRSITFLTMHNTFLILYIQQNHQKQEEKKCLTMKKIRGGLNKLSPSPHWKLYTHIHGSTIRCDCGVCLFLSYSFQFLSVVHSFFLIFYTDFRRRRFFLILLSSQGNSNGWALAKILFDFLSSFLYPF